MATVGNIRWKYDHNVLVGKTAARAMYRGIKDLNAYRMGQEKLPPELHRKLKTVSEVPEACRKIAKEELERLNSEAPLLDPENGNGDALPVGAAEQLERLIAVNQTLIATINNMKHSFGTRISELENTVLDLAAELGAKAQERTKEKEVKRKPRIAVIGVLNDQARILERDFPNVELTCQSSGLARYDPTVCGTHDAVVVTRWSGGAWEQFKKYDNASFVAGGMTSIKEQIKAAAKGFI